MANSPPKATIQALFADFPVSIKSRAWAEEAKVVQRLNNRDSVRLARGVDGGRQHEEGIVHVDDIRTLAIKNVRQLTMRIVSPNAALGDSQPF